MNVFVLIESLLMCLNVILGVSIFGTGLLDFLYAFTALKNVIFTGRERKEGYSEPLIIFERHVDS